MNNVDRILENALTVMYKVFHSKTMLVASALAVTFFGANYVFQLGLVNFDTKFFEIYSVVVFALSLLANTYRKEQI